MQRAKGRSNRKKKKKKKKKKTAQLWGTADLQVPSEPRLPSRTGLARFRLARGSLAAGAQNSAPCPLLEATAVGSYEPTRLAPGADLRPGPRKKVWARLETSQTGYQPSVGGVLRNPRLVETPSIFFD